MEDQKPELPFMQAEDIASKGHGRVYSTKAIKKAVDAINNAVDTDILPEGATLHLDSSVLDPVEGPIPEQKRIHMTPDKFLGVLRKMFEGEKITRAQMIEMRRRFGITNSYFTKPKTDKAKKKKAKAVAKASRRRNRYNNSTKGQKRTHGVG